MRRSCNDVVPAEPVSLDCKPIFVPRRGMVFSVHLGHVVPWDLRASKRAGTEGACLSEHSEPALREHSDLPSTSEVKHTTTTHSEQHTQHHRETNKHNNPNPQQHQQNNHHPPTTQHNTHTTPYEDTYMGGYS